MVGKKIAKKKNKTNRKKKSHRSHRKSWRADKARKIRNLARYIRAPANRNSKEKCVYSNARGFFSEVPEVQIAEMVALAEESTRSENPVDHYVLSLREGETPSVSQVEEAVTIFFDELGLTGHQCIYGLHADTKNPHIHIAVNRVHPESLKCVEVNGGFQLEAVHRAVARIEHAQGWQPEENARYIVMPNGELARVVPERQKAAKLDQQRRDMENRTGEKSAVRIAKESIGDVFKTATTWQELHTRLAAVNLRYQRTGSGAVIYVADVAVKASSVDRTASLAKLEKKLGTFEEHQQGHQDTVGEKQPSRTEFKNEVPRPLIPGVPGWQEYTSQRQTYKRERDAARLALRKQHDIERAEMHARHRTARTEFFASRSWIGKGAEMNAFRSVFAAEHAAEKVAMCERQAMESKRLKKQYPPLPSFKEWLIQHQGPAIANAWRYRANIPQEIVGYESEDIPATPYDDIRAFKPRINGRRVEYVRRDLFDNVLLSHRPSFVDCGRTIQVNNSKDEHATLAALQLAASKWPGGFTLRGNPDFLATCVRLAAEHGLKIKNPELQDAIARERERLALERVDATKSDRQRALEQLFDRYSAEHNADRYRITYTRTFSNGKRQLEIFGREQGFTIDELKQRVRKIAELPKAKITPLYDQPRIVSEHQVATPAPSTATPFTSDTSSQVPQQPPVSEKNDKHGKRPKAALGLAKF